jgi:hypothetical protein
MSTFTPTNAHNWHRRRTSCTPVNGCRTDGRHSKSGATPGICPTRDSAAGGGVYGTDNGAFTRPVAFREYSD